ncbi:MAG: hypothetical protein JKY54_02315, partial [Flavobacteriales bacterium]|nr:hypothetical protein [Flavobacteriales bacterium]
IAAIENIQELIKQQVKQVKLIFPQSIAELRYPSGSSKLEVTENKVSFSYAGDVNELIKWLNQQTLDDVQIIEPTLESVFINYYEN